MIAFSNVNSDKANKQKSEINENGSLEGAIPGVNPTKLFFFEKRRFFFAFFTIKLDHFVVNTLFSFVTNAQA